MKRHRRHGSSALPKPRNSRPRPELCPTSPPKPPAGPALLFGADDPSGKAWHGEAGEVGKKAQLWAWCEWLRLSLVAAAVITAAFVLTARTVAQRTYARSARLQNAPSSLQAHPQPAAVRAAPAIVGAIHYWSDDNSTTVTVDLGALVFFDAQRLTGPDRVYFDLQQTRMPASLNGRLIQVAVGQTFVKKIRVAERGPEVTRVVLETIPNCVYSAMIAPDPYRLVVNLHAPK
ncbi:MAG TPA: AMIN domain-containing protein [Terriglobales bacterium]|nr:AMIN domain-containing protein [Terriglobales bacterium]